MFATQVLRENSSDDETDVEDSSELIGYLIIDGKHHEIKKGETKIGRDPSSCNIVIDNSTVSKIHAVIESDGVDETFIYDFGSTNQTKLGKKVLKPHCRYKLENNKLTLGNVSIEFVLPSDKQPSPVPERKVDLLEELGYIFDIPTQISATDKVPDKQSENFIKPSTIINQSPEPSTSLFNAETQNKLPSPIRTELSDSLNDSSCIFNLNTQCQLYEPSAKSESPKLKSLLNDGQDELLCTFMNLHSANTQSDKVQIKTEKSGVSQVFDEPTQVLAEEEVNELLLNVNASAQNIPQLSVDDKEPSSSPKQTFNEEDLVLTQTFEPPNHENNKTALSEPEDWAINDEDFNETQPYDVEKQIAQENTTTNTSPSSKAEDLNKSVDSYLDATQINAEDDLIATQLFELEKQTEKVQSCSLRNNEDDLVATQVFEWTKPAEKVLNCSQGGNEDDLVATQVFEWTKPTEKAPNCSQRGDEDDLIATQAFVPEEESGCTDRDAIEDLVATQAFELKNPNVQDRNINDSTERDTIDDLIATQTFEPETTERDRETTDDFVATQPANFSPQRTTTKIPQSSPDLLANDRMTSEDGISTQVFETPEQQVQIVLPTKIKIEADAQVVESSGDETESDLEILLEKKDIKEDPGEKKVGESDSDATDCDDIMEMSSKLPVKQEMNKVQFEDTQVLTLSLPSNFTGQDPDPKDNWMVGEESPKFEIDEPWSPLSLEMPCTQDIEATVSRALQNNEESASPSKISRIEVGKPVDSPLKRPLEAVEVVPVKRSKTEDLNKNAEKQLLKLVKNHDIAQIQPNRTRNSLATSENDNNDRRNSLRKSERGRQKKANGDITPYLVKIEGSAQTKESSSRVLRSSKRLPKDETSGVLVESTNNTGNIRRSTRRSLEYFPHSCVHVAFTGFSCDRLEKIIVDLGGKKTNDLSNGEVVVTDEVRRTVKFLCAVGMGLPIVSPLWLLTCKRENRFINPWDFILEDEKAEKKWKFRLKYSLEKAKKQKLLQGYRVFATKNTKPPLKDLMAIVKCCGGTPLLDPPRTWPKKTIFISCQNDKNSWPVPIPKHVRLVHYEFILCCVLRQKIEFKTHCLT